MSLELNLDNATESWDLLTQQLERFIAAWEGEPAPPVLERYVPDGPASLRRLVLAELIKVDLDYRCRRGMFRRLEQYVADHPELQTGDGPPCDLIYEEYHVRKGAGEAVRPEEYLERFPGQAAALCRLLELEGPDRTTALVGAPVGDEWPDGLEAGRQVDDFDLLVPLGKGAFASVFLARQRSMQRLVALKVSADRGTEPQTLAQLDHPNIVRVFDPGLLRQAGDDPAAEQQLIRLARHSGLYLLIAAGVPMLALALLVLSGAEDRLTLALLILAGLLGLADFQDQQVMRGAAE